MENKHYDAFISYRHSWREKLVAVHLQGLLEQMKKPNGKKLHLFRDRSAMGAGNNLEDKIKRALENSDYLIVLCSPNYSQSPYCMEELTYFRKLHNNSNSRIIPLLVSGEPAESFPEQLMWEEQTITREDGTTETVRREIEPLGADVRSFFSIIRHLKLRLTEYLRVASDILGIPFEDLHQRDKRRRLYLYSIFASIAAALSIGFAAYSIHMTNQIKERQQALLANDSLRLASESVLQLEAGNSNLAMLLALEAMPKNLDKPERPLVAEAEAALRSSILTRQWEESTSLLQHITKLEFDTFDWHILGLYDNGRKIAVSDYQDVMLYDTATGMELFRCPAPFADAYFSEDGTYAIIVTGRSNSSAYVYEFTLYNTITKEVLNRQPIPDKEDMLFDFCWDSSTGLYYLKFSESLFKNEDKTLEDAFYRIGMDGSLTACPPHSLDEADLKELGGSYHFDTSTPDYTRFKGIQSDRAERYQAYIEKYWKENYDSACITEDETLLIFSDTYDEKGGQSVIYRLDGQNRGIYDCFTIQGQCYADARQKRLYVLNEHSLTIYTYYATEDTEAKIWGQYKLDEPSLLSTDGSRCFTCSYMVSDPSGDGTYRSGDTEGFWIWNTDDLSRPLLEVFHDCKDFDPYYVSAELEYLFLQTAEDTFQLWSIYDQNALEIRVDPQLGVLTESVSVSADGSLLAIGYETGLVQVYSGKNGQLLTKIDCSEKQKTSYRCTINYLEFEGSCLLITGNPSGHITDDWTWIVDVNNPEKITKIQNSTAWEVFINTDRCLTSDGLLFCTGSYMTDALDAIYDIRTGQLLFEELSYYHYDEATGTLLYLLAHPGFTSNPKVYALRRNPEGTFEELYTLTPQAGEVMFAQNLYCRNSRFVMLAAPACAKVYDLETGEEAFTLHYAIDAENEEYRRSYLWFVDNTIYDIRFRRTGKLARYPMPSAKELADTALGHLTSELGVRSLTDAEKQTFFIENTTP